MRKFFLFLITISVLYGNASYLKAGCVSGDCISGKGTYIYSNGVYTGKWKNGKFHGKGTFTWKDGNTYTGEWKNDKLSGEGTYIWKYGNTYTGEWKNAKRHGKGTFTWKSGNTHRGMERR